MPPSDVRRYKSLPERVLFFLLLCVDDVKISRTLSSILPRTATWCPKVRYSYPVCYDFARPRTLQRVLDGSCA